MVELIVQFFFWGQFLVVERWHWPDKTLTAISTRQNEMMVFFLIDWVAQSIFFCGDCMT